MGLRRGGGGGWKRFSSTWDTVFFKNCANERSGETYEHLVWVVFNEATAMKGEKEVACIDGKGEEEKRRS